MGDVVRMFPIPRHPSKEEEETMKKHTAEREADWTRDIIEKGLEKGLEEVPPKYKQSQKRYMVSGSLCPHISFLDVSFSVSFVVRGQRPHRGR